MRDFQTCSRSVLRVQDLFTHLFIYEAVVSRIQSRCFQNPMLWCLAYHVKNVWANHLRELTRPDAMLWCVWCSEAQIQPPIIALCIKICNAIHPGVSIPYPYIFWRLGLHMCIHDNGFDDLSENVRILGHLSPNSARGAWPVTIIFPGTHKLLRGLAVWT